MAWNVYTGKEYALVYIGLQMQYAPYILDGLPYDFKAEAVEVGIGLCCYKILGAFFDFSVKGILHLQRCPDGCAAAGNV